MLIPFTKYEALGNDFVLVDSTVQIEPAIARRLCDRHFGIGADGVLLLSAPTISGTQTKLVIFNADGTRPELCGNGLRCAALHCVLCHWVDEDNVTSILTDAGPQLITVCRVTPDSATVSVSIGPITTPSPIQIHIADRTYTPWHLSAGNPHTVFIHDDLLAAAFAQLAPQIASHEFFTAGTNVELADVVGPNHLRAVVWERGVGLTLACGTGACACAKAAAHAGLVSPNSPISVDLPGGTLAVQLSESDTHASLTGPVRRVFSGTMLVDD